MKVRLADLHVMIHASRSLVYQTFTSFAEGRRPELTSAEELGVCSSGQVVSRR